MNVGWFKDAGYEDGGRWDLGGKKLGGRGRGGLRVMNPVVEKENGLMGGMV